MIAVWYQKPQEREDNQFMLLERFSTFFNSDYIMLHDVTQVMHDATHMLHDATQVLHDVIQVLHNAT